MGERCTAILVYLEGLPAISEFHLDSRVLDAVWHLSCVVAESRCAGLCRSLGHSEHPLQTLSLARVGHPRHCVTNRCPFVARHLRRLSLTGCSHPGRGVRKFPSSDIRHTSSYSQVPDELPTTYYATICGVSSNHSLLVPIELA